MSHSDSNEAVEPILGSNFSRSATSPVCWIPLVESMYPHKCQQRYREGGSDPLNVQKLIFPSIVIQLLHRKHAFHRSAKP